MKKIILLFSILLCTISVQAQHPGNYVQLLIGKNVTIIADSPFALKYGYMGFSLDEGGSQTYGKVYSELAGKKFKVVDIKANERYPNNYLIKLEGDGKYVYYKYNSKLSDPYFFDVEGGIELPAEYYAEKVTKKVDDDGTITYTSIRTGGMVVIKTIHPEAGTSYGFSCFVFSDNLYGYGDDRWFFISLDNKKIILKEDASIEVDVMSGQFRYNPVFILKDEELAQLKEQTIRLYGVNETVERCSEGEALKGLLNYMETLK